MATVTIEGLQKAQQQNQRRIAALKPAGAFGEAIRWATTELERYAIAATHVDTGALKSSHMMEVHGLRGRIFLSPGAVNPKGQRPAVYGVYEHERGGSHAFYERTVDDHGPHVMQRAVRMVAEAVERA